VSGFSDGRYAPDSFTTRAQFAKMMSASLGIADGNSTVSPFGDLGPQGDGFYPHKFVAAMHSLGLVRGVTPERFAPWRQVSRAQVVTICVRALAKLDPSILATPPRGYTGTLGWFDAAHAETMRIAEYNGLLSGVAGFGRGYDPFRAATRGEVAQLLSRVARAG
jgi:hypothetical protein